MIDALDLLNKYKFELDVNEIKNDMRRYFINLKWMLEK